MLTYVYGLIERERVTVSMIIQIAMYDLKRRRRRETSSGCSRARTRPGRLVGRGELLLVARDDAPQLLLVPRDLSCPP